MCLHDIRRLPWLRVASIAIFAVLFLCGSRFPYAQNAYADSITAGVSEALLQGTEADPVPISLGVAKTGVVIEDGEAWYSFTTTGAHSAYSISISSGFGEYARWDLYDQNGKHVTERTTLVEEAKSVLLAQNALCKIRVRAVWPSSVARFSLTVSEVPSNPQCEALGTDANNPYNLTLGTAVESQFDDPNGSQEQYFMFSTSERHSAYAVGITSNREGRHAYWRLYDTKGSFIASDETTTASTANVLLAANSTYVLKLYGKYSGSTGYLSYRLVVSEVASAHPYPSLGKDKDNPLKLTLGKKVSSQFDDPSGHQVQWFAFKTKSSKKYPYILDFVNKSAGQRLYWTLYDYNGNRITSSNAKTKRSDVVSLKPKTMYRVAIEGWYSGDSGFPSYRFSVSQARPGVVSGLKVSSGLKKIFVKHKGAKPATGYQISYRVVGDKTWASVETPNKKRTLKKRVSNAVYQVKVRAYYKVALKVYYGKWTSVRKVE